MIDYLGRALVRNTLITLSLIVAVLTFGDREASPEAARMQSGNTVLYDHREDCWTGPAPKDAPSVPGHVVMRIEGAPSGSGWFYGGKRYVRIALADVFTKDNPRVHVVAFCR